MNKVRLTLLVSVFALVGLALAGGATSTLIALRQIIGGTAGNVPISDGSRLVSRTLSGDATVSSTGVVTLKNTGTAGTYGSATQSPVFTTDAQGRVTSVTNTTITGTSPGGSAGGDLSGTYPNPTVAAINGATLGTTTATSGNLLIGSGTAWVTKAMSGDATISSLGALTLKNTGTAGTYGASTKTLTLTTDAQGRVTGITENDISGRLGPAASTAGRLQYDNGTVWTATSAGSTGQTWYMNGTVPTPTSLLTMDGTGVTITPTATNKALTVTSTTGSNGTPAISMTNDAAGMITMTNSATAAASAGSVMNLYSGTDPTAASHRLGGFNFGRNVSGTAAVGATMFAFSDEDWSGGNRGSYIEFGTTTKGGSSAATARVRIDSLGNVVLNRSASALATNATGGFTYLPNSAGIPTGTPASSFTGATPIDLNTTGKTLHAYIGSSWVDLLHRPSVALTDAATITTDASLGDVFTVTLGGSRTMAAPTNPTDGQRIIYQIKQDATGSRTITWNSVFRFGTDVASPTLTTTAAKTDYVGFIYNAGATKWDCLAVSRGY